MTYRIIMSAMLCLVISCTDGVKESAHHPGSAESPKKANPSESVELPESAGGPCRVVADERLEKPVKVIVELYRKASGKKRIQCVVPFGRGASVVHGWSLSQGVG